VGGPGHWGHAAAERLTPEWGTFNYWDPEPREAANRIDWIMTEPSIHVHQAAINTYSRNGLVPSDHWPVQALISLP
jgi:endonuclease/exonuclease/phosphatase family metal-dependent hydrolase